jgi:hypothetical protein
LRQDPQALDAELTEAREGAALLRDRQPLSGAAWEDLRIGPEHIPQWERVAIVTDVGWVKHTVNALRFLIPGEVRVTTRDAYQGCAWISSPS